MSIQENVFNSKKGYFTVKRVMNGKPHVRDIYFTTTNIKEKEEAHKLAKKIDAECETKRAKTIGTIKMGINGLNGFTLTAIQNKYIVLSCTFYMNEKRRHHTVSIGKNIDFDTGMKILIDKYSVQYSKEIIASDEYKKAIELTKTTMLFKYNERCKMLEQ